MGLVNSFTTHCPSPVRQGTAKNGDGQDTHRALSFPRYYRPRSLEPAPHFARVFRSSLHFELHPTGHGLRFFLKRDEYSGRFTQLSK